jgi:hypothetical protein
MRNSERIATTSRIVGIFLPGLLFVICAAAQSPSGPACPKIHLDGPAGIGKPGAPEVYSVTLEPTTVALTPVFTWSVHNGTIKSGQGTDRVEVLRSEHFSNTTVTIEITGLPSGCDFKSSETSSICPAPTAQKLDEINGPLSSISRARFERIISDLNANPTARLVIAISGTKISAKSSIAAKKHILIKEISSKFIEGQITLIDIETNDDRVEFWLVPAGADPPAIQGTDARTK